MKKICVAIAGCGDIARIRYLYALESMKDKFELIALHDRDVKKLERVSAETKVQGYANFDEMLGLACLDTVIITTYHPSHADLAVRAMKAGKNVIIEKPFATSGKDARRVVDTAKETGTFCMPLPYEIYPNFVRARELIDQGAIGQVSTCDGIFSHQGPIHAPWFFDREQARWGVMADLGIYILGILAYLLGPFKTVSGKVGILCPERISLTGKPIHCTVEDNAVAYLEWKSGVLGTMRTNWCTAADKNGCIYSITIYGTQGIIYLNMLSHELILYSPSKPVSGSKPINYLGFDESYIIEVPPYDDHINILQSYFDAHDTHVIVEDSGLLARQINVIEAIEKLYLSSDSGKSVELNTLF